MSLRSLSLLLLVSSCAVAPDAESPPGAGRQALAATPVAAKVLFLIDASGSMRLPIDPTSAACEPGCGEGRPCAPACQTRWDLSRTLVSTLLAALPPEAEAALAIYPLDSSCGAPTGLTTAFSARPDFSALATRVPIGGTPTAAALSLALSLPEFADASADRIVVMVTDGLPNCSRRTMRMRAGRDRGPASAPWPTARSFAPPAVSTTTPPSRPRRASAREGCSSSP
jgi:hypothetical protein